MRVSFFHSFSLFEGLHVMFLSNLQFLRFLLLKISHLTVERVSEIGSLRVSLEFKLTKHSFKTVNLCFMLSVRKIMCQIFKVEVKKIYRQIHKMDYSDFRQCY